MVMNMKKRLSIFLIGLFFIGFLHQSATNVLAIHNEEFPENGCDNPTETLRVGVIPGDFKFNVSEVKVGKGACLTVFFYNSDTIEHDFTVVYTNSTGDEVELIHMDAEPGTTINHTWQMPNIDMEVPFFCEVPGHREAGMEGAFILGNPDTGKSGTPGLEFIPALFGLLAVVAIFSRRK